MLICDGVLKSYIERVNSASKANLELKNGVEFLSVIDEKLTQLNSIVTIAADRGTGKTYTMLEWGFKALDIYQPNNEINGVKPLINTLFYMDLDGNKSAINVRGQVTNIVDDERVVYFDKSEMRKENKKLLKQYEQGIKQGTIDKNDENIKELMECLKKWNSKSDKRAFFRYFADNTTDLNGVLLIVDCLNSIVGDVKDDAKCADFYDILDDIKNKGAIIFVFAHCIKTRAENGEPQIAGSHELQDGSDFVYLLIQDSKNPIENLIRFNLISKKERNFRGLEWKKIGLELDLNEPAGYRLRQCEPFTDEQSHKADEYDRIVKASCEVINQKGTTQYDGRRGIALMTLYKETHAKLNGEVGEQKIQRAIKNELSKTISGVLEIIKEIPTGKKPAKIIGINSKLYANTEPIIYEPTA